MSRTVLPKGFIQSNLYNGVGRHVCQLQRLTLKFCKTNGASRGLRDFIENHLLQFSRENPGVVVYLKPRRFRAPMLVGEYLNQAKVEFPVASLKDEEICQWVEHLRSRNGQTITNIEKMWKTETPSIQGIWTPYTNKDTRLNMLTFPNKELGQYPNPPITGTERLLQLVREQNLDNIVVQEVDEQHCQ